MQHIIDFAFSTFQQWGHIDPNISGIGLMIKNRQKSPSFESLKLLYGFYVLSILKIVLEYAETVLLHEL